MSNVTLEKIIEEVKALSPEEQSQLREMLNAEANATKQPERARLVKSIRGKYAHVQTSSEDFIRRKQEEIELENRRWRDSEPLPEAKQ
jgi:hypothetical protein